MLHLRWIGAQQNFTLLYHKSGFLHREQNIHELLKRCKKGKSQGLTPWDLDYYRKYILINIKSSYLRVMVEMMGIEPMSENPATRPSPWAVCYLTFPVGGANKHAPPQSSPFLLDRFKGETPMQVHRSCDAQSSVAVVRGGTGDPQVTALPIGIPEGMSIRQP